MGLPFIKKQSFSPKGSDKSINNVLFLEVKPDPSQTSGANRRTDLSTIMHLGIWVSGGLDNAGLNAGLDDLGGFFQPEWFYDFMLLISACSTSKVTSLHSSHSYNYTVAVTRAVALIKMELGRLFLPDEFLMQLR